MEVEVNWAIDGDSTKTQSSQSSQSYCSTSRGSLMLWASRGNSYQKKLRAQAAEEESQLLDENSRRMSEILTGTIEASLNNLQSDSAPASVPGTPPLNIFKAKLTAKSGISDSSFSAIMSPVHMSHGSSYNLSPVKVSSIETNYARISERIWRCDDQKASLFLQERLKHAVPGEFEHIVAVVHAQLEALMIHRFGNFLVQCMLGLSHADDISRVASVISGKVAELSMHQFGCHVVQKLLDVSSLVIQAHVVAELFDQAVVTMTCPFGTHVWQKLFHLPWSPKLPKISSLANNAVHIDAPHKGWMAITETEAGCATLKSYLSIPNMDAGIQECIEELLQNITSLITRPHCSVIVGKLMLGISTRARTIAHIKGKASEYCKHPTGSTALLLLLRLKIPSFPTQLSLAIVPHREELLHHKHAAAVLTALDSTMD